VADELRSASQAVGRGSNQEALVHLWNAMEPARLAGDARRLRSIAGLAQRIRSQGDEGEAREAERLLEQLRSTVGDDGGIAPATGRLDAEVYASGEPAEDLQPEEEQTGRGIRIGNLVWIALVIAIILFNLLGERGGG
jgi:hypothetical protein